MEKRKLEVSSGTYEGVDLSDKSKTKKRRGDKCPPSAFRHEPLQDPETQIRLLRILPGKKLHNVQLELSVWDLDSTPDFHAISYTWGKKVWRTVWIDGLVFHVRENCQYALWQARLHYPGYYFWIDSICIHQDDTHEKTHQVGLMGRVYQQATRVVACVGPHADNSSNLARMTAYVAAHTVPYTNIYDFSQDYKYIASEELEDFDTTIKAFVKREYWSRLWIVQELAAAKCDETDVLCGDILLSKAGLDTLFELLCMNFVPTKEQYHYYWVMHVEVGAFSFFWCMHSFYKRQCSDRRDRVYGILSLLHPDDPGRRIVPNYDLLPEDLAELICFTCHLHFYDVDRVLDALEIDPGNSRMMELVKQRQAPETVNLNEMQISSEIAPWQPLDKTSLRLVRGVDGELVLPLQTASGSDPGSMALERYAAAIITKDRYQCVFGIDQPSAVIGLICSGARAGDIVFPARPVDDAFRDVALVARRSEGNEYDIVGQMIFRVQNWMINEERLSRTQVGPSIDYMAGDIIPCHIRLRCSAEDGLVLVGQSISDQIVETVEEHTLLIERLITRPMLSTFSAATITTSFDVNVVMWLQRRRMGLEVDERVGCTE